MSFRKRVKLRNPSDSRKRESEVLAYAAAAIFLIVLTSLFLAIAGVRNPLSIPIFWLSNGTVSVLRAIGDGFVSLGYVFKLKPILEKSIELENENALLKKQIGDLEVYQAEAVRLQRLLKVPELEKFDYVTTRIVGRNLDLWFDSVYIDRGSNSNINEGDLVINANGLVGEVIRADNSTSKVRLLLNPDFAIGAITSKSRQHGVIVGGTQEELGLVNSLELGFVPKKNRIELGEKVYTSGLATGRPRGILIGTVSKVVEEPNRITQTIEVTPAVDLGSLEEVVVILYKQETTELNLEQGVSVR